MNRSILLTPRIALFAALIYVFSMGTSFIPNVNLLFFIIFISGYMWGVFPGMIVGAVGMGLWAFFNPFGPSIIPILLAQITGAALCGLVGGLTSSKLVESAGWKSSLSLVIASIICTAMYFFPVNFIDAWLFKPFWPRFIMSWYWSLISVGANILIFPLLFGVLKVFFVKERIKFQ